MNVVLFDGGWGPRWWLMLLALATLGRFEASGGDLEVVRDREPQRIFAGEQRTIAVVFRNAGDSAIDADVRMRLSQTTSATAVRVAETQWKHLRMLPRQTVLESAALDFPAVRAETRFVVQWLESTNASAGSSEVLVYPTNLLEELRPLVGDDEGALGVFDPLDQVKPLLEGAQVSFADLGAAGLEQFSGKLAIVGPFESPAQVPESLPEQVRKLARRGVAVVWIQPRETAETLQPSFYAVPGHEIATVIVQAEVVANLFDNPGARLNLVRLCRLALHPEPPQLPVLALHR